MRHHHVSIGQRILAMALAVVMVFGMATPAASATENEFVGELIRPNLGNLGSAASGGESAILTVDEETMVATLNSNTLTETTVGGVTGWWLDLDIEVQTDTSTMEQVMYWAKYQVVVTSGDSAEAENGAFADKCAEGDTLGRFNTKLPDAETIKQLAYNGEKLKVEWKFDWNGDETFDQVITLDVDPADLTLKNAAGDVVYPEAATQYGTVSGLTAGLKIENADPADITVSSQAVVLSWVPADPSIGRTVDGWWLGFRIDAPAMTEEDLQKVHYKIGDSVASFWESKESAPGAETHYMTLWVCMNDVLFKEKRNAVTCQFDWNQDGVYEQKVTLAESKLGEALKLKQDGFDITKDTVTLKLNVKGNGSVKINGETVTGEQTLIKNLAYNVELVPNDENTKVTSIKLGKDTVTELPKRFDDNQTLSVTFATKYKVVVPQELPEGCKVVLTDWRGNVRESNEYDPNSWAYCTVTAGEGYRIKEVKYGSEVIPLNGKTDEISFYRQVTGNAEITVTFAQIYQVNVKVDGSGQVWINDEAANGKITVEQIPGTEKLALRAVPGENHRVTEVLLNNETKLDVPGENSAVFETQLDYGNYEIQVTFAPNVHTVRVEDGALEHVTVTGLPEGKVEYGSELKLTLTPEEGYMITGVTAEGAQVKTNATNTEVTLTIQGDTVLKINPMRYEYTVVAAEDARAELKLFLGDAELTEEDKVGHGETIRVQVLPAEGFLVKSLSIKDKNGQVKQTVNVENGTAEIVVQMDMTIVANVEEIKAVQLSDVRLSLSTDGLLRQEGGLYVYCPGSVVKITASTVENEIDPNAQFRIGFASGNIGNGIYQENISATQGVLVLNTANDEGIPSDQEVDGVAYVLQYLSAEGWAKVVDSNDNPIRIMFDKDLPVIGDVQLSSVAEGAQEGFYAADLTFDVDATDKVEGAIDYTEIASVEYVLSESELDSDDLGAAAWVSVSDITKGADVQIQETIAAAENNGKELYLSLRVTDAAKNVSTKLNAVKFCVDTAEPTVEKVTADGKELEGAQEGFLKVDQQNVTIELNEWDKSFDEDQAVLTLMRNGKPVDVDVEWSIVDGKPVGTFQVTEEGAYEWSMAYTSRTGAKLDIAGESKEYKFTIDRTAPKGETLKVDETAAPNFMDKLLEKITFGFFKSNKTTYTAEWKDATEVSVTYMRSDLSFFEDVADMEGLVAKLERDGKFTAENTWDVEDGDYVIFARAVDAAGNVGYTSTEGVIFDSKEPVIDVVITEATYDGQAADNGPVTLANDKSAQFGDSFNVQINVTDNVLKKQSGDTEVEIAGSGLKSVYYVVNATYTYSNGHQWTNPYPIVDGGVKKTDESYALKDRKEFATFADGFDIDVEKDKYYGVFIDYTLTVTAEDFAGHKTVYESKVEVNVEPPKAKVTMDEAKERPVWATGNYYNYARTATVTITDHERSWDPAGVALKVIDPSSAEQKDMDPSWIGEWTSDGNEHTATITFPETEGHYKWDITYTNKHGRRLETKAVTTVEGANTFDFYQDFTAPEAEISTGDFWGKFIEVITFGLIQKDTANVTVQAKDDNGKVMAYAYRHQGKNEPMSEEGLNQYRIHGFESVALDKEGAGTVSVAVGEQTTVVYFFVSDYAGNAYYLSSTGIIVEDHKPEVEITAQKTWINAADESFDLTIRVSDIQEVLHDSGKREKLHDSGINSVCYWVETPNGAKLIEGKVASFDVENPTYDDLWHEKTWTVTLGENDLNTINYTGARFVAKATDNAGNESEASIELDVDRTCPEVTVKFDEDEGNAGYYNYNRTATITFVERGQHFAWNDEAPNNNDACGAVMVGLTAEDVKGNAIDLRFGNGKVSEEQYDVIFDDKQTSNGNKDNGDEDTHVLKVLFCGDANYDWSSLTFTDKLGNPAKITFEGENANKFTVDKTDPTGSMTAVPDGRADRGDTWNEQVFTDTGDLVFNLWASKKMTVSGSADDVTSPVVAMDYYVSTLTRSMQESELKNLEDKDWAPVENLAKIHEQTSNLEYAVYLRITDKAGNQAYLRTDGLIVDQELPNLGETNAPEIEVVAPYEGQIYNSDVDMDIIVKDLGSASSGLKRITYAVYNDDISTTKPTQSGDLWTFDTEDPKKGELWTEVKEELKVIAKSADGMVDNNSNNVRVVITAVDNAGNVETKTIKLMIDVTEPKITVSYTNNSGIKHADGRTYFDKTRVATVEVTERNFNKNLVQMQIGAAHGSNVTITDWSKKVGTKANGDDTVWTATITYRADDDYTFGISCTDNAKNANKPVTYTGTAPTAFTVDQTKPVVSVSYDNNTDNNGNGYFKAYRTATITILEHNFDSKQVDITLGATLDGSPIAKPAISDWHKSGDRWTATVSFHADGDYTFDVTAKDKAGNDSGPASYGSSKAPKAFTVDTTLVEPAITGVETGKAYPGELIPSVSFSDVNFAGYELKLLRTNLGTIDEDISKEMTDLIQQTEQTITGVFDIFQIVANDPGAKDGIYKLALRVWDDAGNESIQELTFSVNRNGSVYVYGEYLVDLLEQGHVTAVDGELTVTEYNADRLVPDSLLVRVTHNGRAMADVALSPEPVINDQVSVGEMGWYEYVYTMSSEYFAEDGIYQITYSSKDAAGNTSDNSEVRFVVDSEKPELSSVIGMEEPIVNAPSLDVQFNAYDSLGLKSITILVDGEVVDTITEFGEDINSYSGVFTLEESKFTRNVQIIVEDMAGNILDTDAEDFAPVYEFNKEITVSTNFFVRWYANTVLFWCSIAAMGLLAYLLWFFLIFKRKKKDEEENGEQK